MPRGALSCFAKIYPFDLDLFVLKQLVDVRHNFRILKREDNTAGVQISVAPTRIDVGTQPAAQNAVCRATTAHLAATQAILHQAWATATNRTCRSISTNDGTTSLLQ